MSTRVLLLPGGAITRRMSEVRRQVGRVKCGDSRGVTVGSDVLIAAGFCEY